MRGRPVLSFESMLAICVTILGLMLSFRVKTGPTAFSKLYLQICGEEMLHVELEE